MAIKSERVDLSTYVKGVVPKCDGCQRDLVAGEPVVVGIRSCCGACPRAICMDCARGISKLAEAAAARGVTP